MTPATSTTTSRPASATTGPGLDSCVRALRTGDVLVVWKLDRLGRTLAHLVNTVQDLSARGVGLRVLTGQGAQIDTTTATDREVLNLGARLDAIEKKILARLDQQVNAMTGRLERIECKVDGLDAQILPAGTDADTGSTRTAR